MSYEYDRMNKIIADNSAKAESIRQKVGFNIENTRNNTNLSDAGKRGQLAALYLGAKRDISVLRSSDDSARNTAKLQLEKDLFGSVSNDPNLIIAARDAHDRVSKIEDREEALDAARRATLNNDSTMISALVKRASEWGWNEALDVIFEGKPSHSEKIQELSVLSSTANDIGHIMRAEMQYGLPAPTEVSDKSDAELERMSTVDAFAAVLSTTQNPQ